LLAIKLDASHVLGLVSFDCHPGSPFFSHRRRMLILFVYVFSFQHHSLSLRRRPLLFRQQHSLSLSLKGHSLDLCAQMSPPAYPVHRRQLRALRIVLNFSPQKASAAAGRPAAFAMAKGASRHRLRRPPCCRRGRDASSDPPPHGRVRLVESHRQGGN
jgi:hypothetical protein